MRKYEDELIKKGIRFIAGVDEVGRGPLAGPVVAAAVILPLTFNVSGIDDSKKLTEKKRENLFPLITELSLAYGTGMVDNRVIDKINILQATKKAMMIAINEAAAVLAEKTGEKLEHVLIDAVKLEGLLLPQTNIIKGDENSVSIAAASIVAKVMRDRLMREYHDKYPGYGFESNKGYGTKAHYAGISKHGICDIHRKSFLRNIDEEK